MAGPTLGGGVGRKPRYRAYRPMSEINVTPMVDVMLVLLVIFMVTAPMLTAGVKVDLPQTEASTLNEKSDEPLTVSVKRDGTVYLQETKLTRDELVARLKAVLREKQDQRIFVRGDRNAVYGEVLSVMGTLRAAGFNRVALLAELPRGDAE